jgi:hypothetical protein
LALAAPVAFLPPHHIPFTDHALVSTPLVGAKYVLKVHFSLSAVKPLRVE